MPVQFAYRSELPATLKIRIAKSVRRIASYLVAAHLLIQYPAKPEDKANQKKRAEGIVFYQIKIFSAGR